MTHLVHVLGLCAFVGCSLGCGAGAGVVPTGEGAASLAYQVALCVAERCTRDRPLRLESTSELEGPGAAGANRGEDCGEPLHHFALLFSTPGRRHVAIDCACQDGLMMCAERMAHPTDAQVDAVRDCWVNTVEEE